MVSTDIDSNTRRERSGLPAPVSDLYRYVRRTTEERAHGKTEGIDGWRRWRWQPQWRCSPAASRPSPARRAPRTGAGTSRRRRGAGRWRTGRRAARRGSRGWCARRRAAAARRAARRRRAPAVPGLADAANVGGDYGPKPPVLALTPEEQAKRFILPPGYRIELVLSDPDIVSPAAMAFDGNGRLYVAELRSYMLDVDAGRQHEPTSRISMHESTKGDGKFDKHTVFADNLLFPRMVLPLDKGILTNETHSDDVLMLTDTNGDGVADKRQVFYTGVGTGRSGNVQQAQSGFVWGARQLDLQHLQRVPLPLDAARHRPRALRALRAPSGACRWTTTGRSGW